MILLRTFRFRLSAVIFALVAALVSLLLWAVASTSLSGQEKRLLEREEVFIDISSEHLRQDLLIGEYFDAQTAVMTLARDPHVTRIILADRRGRIVASSAGADIGKTLEPARMTEPGWRLRTIENPAGPLGTLAVRFLRDELETAKREYRRVAIMLLAPLFLVFAAFSWLLGTLLTRRVEALNAAVQELAKGNLNSRLTETGNDEITELARVFNTMAQSLQEMFETVSASKEKYRNLVEHSSVWIWETDASLRHVYSNSFIETILGYPVEEFLRLDIFSVVHEDDHDTLRQIAERAISRGEPWRDRVIRWRHKDGSWRHLESSGTPFFSPAGQLLGLRGVDRDITERERLASIIREKEERFRGLAERTSDWLWEIDEHGRYTYVSPVVNNILGYDPQEVLGKSPFDFMPPDEARRVAEVFGPIVEARLPITSMENANLHRNGHLIILETSGIPIVDDGGQFKGYRGVDRDITKRKQAEEAIRELNRTLETRVEHETRLRLEQERMLVQQSKMAAMGEMIGAIAHQWRQPLNAVGVIMQDVRDAFSFGRLDQAYLQHAVDDAMNQVRFMSKTIEDFQNFFRPDREAVVFDLKQALAHVLSLISSQLKSNGITWLITCQVHGKSFRPGDPVESCGEMSVTGYENELKQVFLNLIENAKDAIVDARQRSPGGEPGEGLIRVDFSREGMKTVIRFTDNGGGIPEAILDRIFEPYFSTREQGHGTGIGLYMCKMIVERNMGGRITALNTENGAELRIEL